MSSDQNKKIQKQLDGLLDGFSSFSGSEFQTRNQENTEANDEAFRTHAESSPLVSVLLERASVMEDSGHASEMICEAAKIHMDVEDGEDASFTVLSDGLRKFPANLRIADMLFSWGNRFGRFAEVKSHLERAQKESKTKHHQGDCFKLRLAALDCQLGQPEKALRNLKEIISLESDDNIDIYFDVFEDQTFTESSVLAYAEFFERMNQHDRALRVLNKAVVVSSDANKKSNFYFQIGLLETTLGRVRTAEWNFEQALMMNPTCDIALSQMRKCLRGQGKAHELLRILTKVHALNTTAEKRAELAYEIALLHGELGNKAEAMDCLKRSLDDNPMHEMASYAMAMSLSDHGRLDEAAAYFDKVLGHLSTSHLEPLEVLSKAAFCYSACGSHDKAVVAFEMALECEDNNTALRIGLAFALFHNKEFKRAYSMATSVFTGNEECTSEEVASLFGIMGDCQNHLGNGEQAAALYRRSLEASFSKNTWQRYDDLLSLDNQFEPRVKLLTSVYQELEEKDLSNALRALSDTAMSNRQVSEKLTVFFLFALDRFEQNRALLQSAIDYLSFAKKWTEAVQAILKVAHMETRNFEKAKFFHAAFSLERKYGDAVEAAAYGNAAIDCYFGVSKEDKTDDAKKTAVELFYKINDTFFRMQNFKEIERNYRKILKKFGPKDGIAADLWNEIASIYRDHLEKPKLAIQAFEVAAELNGSGVDGEKNLLHLYEMTGDDLSEKAIQKRLKMQRMEPFECDHYKALRKYYVAKREMDKVWCITQVLSLLGQADESEKHFFERFKRVDKPIKQQMSDADWEHLGSNEEHRNIGKIFGILCETVALEHAREPKHFDLESDSSFSFEMLRKLCKSIQSAMGCPTFEFLIQPQKLEGVSLKNVKADNALYPMLALGRQAYEGRNTQNIRFELARHLTYTKRENLLSLIVKDENELSALFCAAVSLVYPKTKAPRHLHKKIVKFKKHLEDRLTLPLRQDLTRAVVEFAANGGHSSMAEWRTSVEQMSLNAAFLVSGDLKMASSYLAEKNKNKLRSDKAKELGALLSFCVSEEHFLLRKKLGLAIDSIEPKAPSRTVSGR